MYTYGGDKPFHVLFRKIRGGDRHDGEKFTIHILRFYWTGGGPGTKLQTQDRVCSILAIFILGSHPLHSSTWVRNRPDIRLNPVPAGYPASISGSGPVS